MKMYVFCFAYKIMVNVLQGIAKVTIFVRFWEIFSEFFCSPVNSWMNAKEIKLKILDVFILDVDEIYKYQ